MSRTATDTWGRVPELLRRVAERFPVIPEHRCDCQCWECLRKRAERTIGKIRRGDYRFAVLPDAPQEVKHGQL